MKTLLLFLFVLIGYCSFSQDFILDKRWKIKNKMEKFYTEHNRKYIFSETDSTISFVLSDSLSLPVVNVFYFNKQDRCIKQENIFSCDSCMQQSRQQFLNNKFANWEKIGMDEYYAGFPYNALMQQIHINDRYILRLSWIKKKDLKFSKADQLNSNGQ